MKLLVPLLVVIVACVHGHEMPETIYHSLYEQFAANCSSFQFSQLIGAICYYSPETGPGSFAQFDAVSHQEAIAVCTAGDADVLSVRSADVYNQLYDVGDPTNSLLAKLNAGGHGDKCWHSVVSDSGGNSFFMTTSLNETDESLWARHNFVELDLTTINDAGKCAEIEYVVGKLKLSDCTLARPVVCQKKFTGGQFELLYDEMRYINATASATTATAVTSVWLCAYKCLKTAGCLSFNYRRWAKECEMFYPKPSYSNMTAEAGCRHYQRIY